MLKGQSDVDGDDFRAKYFRAQALESQNQQVFIAVVKRNSKLKVFHYMVKYNDMFATNNISDIVIVFMGDRLLEGRLWVFDISLDNPWAWPEVEYFNNAI